MSAVHGAPPLSTSAPEPDVAYAQSFFSGCAAALSTLLNRAVTVDLLPGLVPASDDLAATLPMPWVIASARFTRSLAGVHELVLSRLEAVVLSRLVLGEEPGESAEFSAAHQDALREALNQMFSSAAAALRGLLGKPVGVASAELRQVEHAEAWHPPAATRAMGALTMDGVPHARLALAIPSSVRGEGASAQPAARPAKPAAASLGMDPRLELILDIAMPVTVELGRTKMLIRDILALGPGSIVELDRLAGEPVDVLVNDRPIAKGEVVVIDENFGVRLTQIIQASDRLRSLA